MGKIKVNKELLKKAEDEVEKAGKLLQGIEHLPPDSVSNYLHFLLNALNYLAQAVLGGGTIIDKDFFSISGVIDEKIREEMFDVYFSIKSLMNKNFKKVSRTTFRVDSWKYSTYLSKEDMNDLYKKVSTLVTVFKSF